MKSLPEPAFIILELISEKLWGFCVCQSAATLKNTAERLAYLMPPKKQMKLPGTMVLKILAASSLMGETCSIHQEDTSQARPRVSPVQPRPNQIHPGRAQPRPGPSLAQARSGNLENWYPQNKKKNKSQNNNLCHPQGCELLWFTFVLPQERRATTFEPWDRKRRS